MVNSINRVAGEEVLYLSECVNMWMLFERPSEEDVDRMLMHGFTDSEDLARLVVRLENEMRGVEGTFASAACGRGSEQKGCGLLFGTADNCNAYHRQALRASQEAD